MNDEDEHGWQALLLHDEPASSSTELSQEAQQQHQQQLEELALPP